MDWYPEKWVSFQHWSENCAYTHFAWMQPFDLAQQCCGAEGYKMADPVVNADCDVPNCYQLIAESWTGCVVEAINCLEFIVNLKAVSNDCFDIDLIRVSKHSRLSFIHYGDCMFNPKFAHIPHSLFPCHPDQGPLTVPHHYLKVHHFYLMDALICDSKEDYDDDETQDP